MIPAKPDLSHVPCRCSCWQSERCCLSVFRIVVANAVGATLTSLFCVAAFLLPRRLAALSMLAATLYIAAGQVLDSGINFIAIRFVESAAVLRVIKSACQSSRISLIS